MIPASTASDRPYVDNNEFVAPQSSGASMSSAPPQGAGEPPILQSGVFGAPNLGLGDAGATVKGKLAAPGVKETT